MGLLGRLRTLVEILVRRVRPSHLHTPRPQVSERTASSPAAAVLGCPLGASPEVDRNPSISHAPAAAVPLPLWTSTWEKRYLCQRGASACPKKGGVASVDARYDGLALAQRLAVMVCPPSRTSIKRARCRGVALAIHDVWLK